MINWIKRKYNTWLINHLVKFSGVRLDPDPGVWGIMNQEQEDATLAKLYEDDGFVLLFKKYAENANKSTLASMNQVELGKFHAFNGILLKARRAYKKANESRNKKDRN